MPAPQNNNPIQTSTEPSYETPFHVDLNTLIDDAQALEDYFAEISALPEKLQNILADFSTAEFIEEDLGPKYALNAEQKKDVARVLRDLIMGKMPLGELLPKIEEKLQLYPADAEQVAGDLFRGLFTPQAFNDLKAAQRERFPNKNTDNFVPAAPASPPTPLQAPVKTAPPAGADGRSAPPPPSQDVNKNNIIDLRITK